MQSLLSITLYRQTTHTHTHIHTHTTHLSPLIKIWAALNTPLELCTPRTLVLPSLLSQPFRMNQSSINCLHVAAQVAVYQASMAKWQKQYFTWSIFVSMAPDRRVHFGLSLQRWLQYVVCCALHVPWLPASSSPRRRCSGREINSFGVIWYSCMKLKVMDWLFESLSTGTWQRSLFIGSQQFFFTSIYHSVCLSVFVSLFCFRLCSRTFLQACCCTSFQHVLNGTTGSSQHIAIHLNKRELWRATDLSLHISVPSY